VAAPRRHIGSGTRIALVAGGVSALALLVAGGAVLLGGDGSTGAAADGAGARPAPRPVAAVPAIVDAFRDHPVVAIGESHDLAEAGELYRALVRSRRFAAAVDAVVVEFGNARSQAVVDRYVADDDVPLRRLRKVWRDTTQVGSWDAPMYAAFFAAVRRANEDAPPSERLRVLLGDPSIDWSRVHRRSQWDAVARRRERFMARLIEHEVLAKGGTALVIAGLAHVARGGGGVTDLLERRRPGAVFVAGVHVGFPSDAWERRLASWPEPSLAAIDGTWIGALPQGDGHAEDSLDGLLYLGAPASLHLAVPLPAVYRDSRYWKALRARFELVNGRPFSARGLFAAYASPPYPTGYDPDEVRRAQRFARCIRARGVASFPDPAFQFDAVGFFGDAVAQAETDPDFEAAQRFCARTVLELAPPGGG
jgi:hypothetical protein